MDQLPEPTTAAVPEQSKKGPSGRRGGRKTSKSRQGELEKFSQPAFDPFGPYIPEGYQTTPSGPKERVKIAPDLREVLASSVDIHRLFQASPKYQAMLSNVVATDLTDGYGLKRAFIATSILALAQQVAIARKTATGSIGKWSVLDHSELPIAGCFRVYASQFGDFQIPQIGEMFDIADFDRTIDRIIRLAHGIFTTENEDDIDTWEWFAAESFLPVVDADRTVDEYVKQLFNQALARHFQNIEIAWTGDLFTGNIPETLAGLVVALPDADQVDARALVEAVFADRPVGAQAWCDWLDAHAAELDYDMPDDYDPNGRGENLYRGNTIQLARNIIDFWTEVVPLIKDYVHLMDVTLLDGITGQPTQVGETWEGEEGSVTGVRYLYSVTPKLTTLANIYYPKSWYFQRPKDLRSRFGGDTPNVLESLPREKTELRRRFVSGFYK